MRLELNPTSRESLLRSVSKECLTLPNKHSSLAPPAAAKARYSAVGWKWESQARERKGERKRERKKNNPEA